MKKDISGRAFPHSVHISEAYKMTVDDLEEIIGDTYGLTKREYFAAKAMLGFIMSGWSANSARKAVEKADELLKELEK